MKLHTKQANIERSGIQAESNFTIKTNALSFSILSSGLYTDPIMAIVRELSCNAYDAHVDANNSITPFEIHLPNDLEPFFSIKDFGTGLSNEDIQGELVPIKNTDGSIDHICSGGLYTTYFDSTKTHSNDFIGALGLGSKTPFSYADAFEVISRFGGTKHTYAVFLNEEGIPSIALMGKIETDEHSGLEIKLTVKKDDFRSFHSKTATALKFFDVKPVIKGVLNFEFDSLPTHNIETEHWMLSPAYNSYTRSIIAVQGNVQYRVDFNQIKNELSVKLLTFIKNSNIITFFDIGDLEVAANREEIRYDKKSVEAIIARLEMISNEITFEVEKKIGNLGTSFWDACCMLNDLSSELFGNASTLCNIVSSDNINNDMLSKYIKQDRQVHFIHPYGHKMYRYETTRGVNIGVKRTSVGNTITPHENTFFIINDVPTGGIKRLSTYLNMSERYYSTVVLITKLKDPALELDDDGKTIPYIGYDVELKQLLNDLGNPKALLLSKITTAENKLTVNTSLPFYKYDGVGVKYSYYNVSHKLHWEKTSGSISDGGIYIPLKFGSTPATLNTFDNTLNMLPCENPTLFSKAINILINTYNEAHDTSYCQYDLHGLPTRTCLKASKMDNWVNIFDFIEPALQKSKKIIDFSARKQATEDVFNIMAVISSHGFTEGVKGLSKRSTFRKRVLPLIEDNTNYTDSNLENAEAILNLAKILKIEIDVSDNPFFIEKDFTKYSMFTLVGGVSYYTNWNTYFNYIKLIDRSKK